MRYLLQGKCSKFSLTVFRSKNNDVMLRKKLFAKSKGIEDSEPQQKKRVLEESSEMRSSTASTLFATPIWKQFYDLECELNAQLQMLAPPDHITHIYNPVEYAAEVHCAYLRQYLRGRKKVIFVGMNPGPNGMNQTGVPFGNINTIRNLMGLSGNVGQPPVLHPQRPVNGLNCTSEEPSGKLLWTLMQKLANGSLETFAQQCFVHNFCPLAFFDQEGHNITPPEIESVEYRNQLRDFCIATLDKQIDLLQSEIVVPIGNYVHTCLKRSSHRTHLKVFKLVHPSPRVRNNQNWLETAEEMLQENDVIKFIRNQV